ncbi:MAG: histidine phosphatase family protein [Isosphaeraceae bacterium]
METRILLLRHAETSAPDQFHGAESDVGLGERGQVQAAAVALDLASRRPDALVCSGMRRARETAAAIAGACGLVPEIQEALHERRMGFLSGRPKAESMPIYEAERTRWMAGDLDASHDGAESFAEVRDRVAPIFLALAERWRGRTVVVVAHGLVIRVVLTTLLDGFSPADFQRIGISNVAVNEILWDGERWGLVALGG